MSRKTQQISLLIVGATLAGFLYYNNRNKSVQNITNKTSTTAVLSGNTDGPFSLNLFINEELSKVGFSNEVDPTIILAKASKTGDSYLFALAKTQKALLTNNIEQLNQTATEIDSFCIVLENDPRSKKLELIPEAILNQALKIDSLNINTLNTLALLKIYRHEQIMEGVQLLKKVVQIDSNNEEALYQLGLLSVKSGQTDKAIERFKKLISLQPLKKGYHQQLALLYSQKGDAKNAEKHAVLAR